MTLEEAIHQARNDADKDDAMTELFIHLVMSIRDLAGTMQALEATTRRGLHQIDDTLNTGLSNLYERSK